MSFLISSPAFYSKALYTSSFGFSFPFLLKQQRKIPGHRCLRALEVAGIALRIPRQLTRSAATKGSKAPVTLTGWVFGDVVFGILFVCVFLFCLVFRLCVFLFLFPLVCVLLALFVACSLVLVCCCFCEFVFFAFCCMMASFVCPFVGLCGYLCIAWRVVCPCFSSLRIPQHFVYGLFTLLLWSPSTKCLYIVLL